MNKQQLRNWGLDVLIGIIELRFHRFFAFIAYVGIKQAVPDWKLPRWERYALFPGSFFLDMMLGRGRRGVVKSRPRRY